MGAFESESHFLEKIFLDNLTLKPKFSIASIKLETPFSYSYFYMFPFANINKNHNTTYPPFELDFSGNLSFKKGRAVSHKRILKSVAETLKSKEATREL